MSKQSTKKGFLIKLSCETVQKLTEQQVKQAIDNATACADTDHPINEDVEQWTSDKTTVTGNLENSLEPSFSKEKPNVESSEISKKKDTEDKESTGNESKTSHSWGEYAAYVTYEGEEAVYTDPSTKQQYIWNKESSAWDPKSGQSEVPGRVYSYEDDTHIYTETDGSKFFWDEEKKAWIPKVDDDFLAFYQMSYGFVDNSSKDEKPKEEDKKDGPKKVELGVKRKNEPQWFQPPEETNTKVYVSNLPLDLTEEEFVNLMQKCGLIERDPSTQQMKVKLYMDKEQDCFKGDALCTYIKIESVELALNLLDGSDYKGNKIKVERAHFQLKGEYNPALKPKKKKKKELEKLKKMRDKLFDWRPEKFVGERGKHEKVVIVKNLFRPTDFDKEVQLILDYQQDLREECSKAGEVRKVVIYDRHPEGVAQITMKEPEQADAVVELINGRWFGKRQITAEIWDGRTKYKIAETDAEINKRIDGWDKFLEGEDGKNKSKGDDKKVETTTDPAVEPDTELKEKNESVVELQEKIDCKE